MALGGCVALSSLRARALMGGMVVLPTTAAPFTSTAATAMFTFMMMVTMVIMVIMVIVMTTAMFSIMMMVTMVIMVIMVIVMTMMIMMIMMICLHRSRTRHGSTGSAQASSSVRFIVSVHGLLHCVMEMFAARRENGGVEGWGGGGGMGWEEERSATRGTMARQRYSILQQRGLCTEVPDPN